MITGDTDVICCPSPVSVSHVCLLLSIAFFSATAVILLLLVYLAGKRSETISCMESYPLIKMKQLVDIELSPKAKYALDHDVTHVKYQNDKP